MTSSVLIFALPEKIINMINITLFKKVTRGTSMKLYKILAIVISSAIVVAAVGTYFLFTKNEPNEGESTPRFALEIYGNANLDERIDEKDIEFLEKIVSGQENETDFADANRDGVINQEDIDQVRVLVNGTASFIWILDGNRNPVRVNLPIERIGAEYLSNVELLRILGVEERVVAVDMAPYKLRWFYLPEKADQVVNLGDMNAPDYEFILSLNLDVLFTFSYNIDQKRQNLPGVDVVFLGLYWPDVIKPADSRFIQGVLKAGYMLGKSERAHEYVNWIFGLIDSIKSRTVALSADDKPRVLMTGMVGYMRDPTQTTMRTYNLIDPLSQMCILAGGKPVAQDLPDWLGSNYYSTVDLEWVLEKDPDFIFVHAVRYTYGGQTQQPAYGYDMNSTISLNETWQNIVSRPLLSSVKAVRNGDVYIIAGDFRNNAMGSVLGAVYLAKILQPELFEDLDPEAIHQEYISYWLNLEYDLDEHGTFLFPPIVIGDDVIGAPN
ncbi:MAG: ABC transporter substrate-binding protein [Methanomassiliicoccales archaeon]